MASGTRGRKKAAKRPTKRRAQPPRRDRQPKLERDASKQRDARAFNEALRRAQCNPLHEAGRTKEALVFFLRALATDHRRVPQRRIELLEGRLKGGTGAVQLTAGDRKDLVWLLADHRRLQRLDADASQDDAGRWLPLGKGCPRCDNVLVQSYLRMVGLVESYLAMLDRDAAAAGAPREPDPDGDARLVKAAALERFTEKWGFPRVRAAEDWLRERAASYPELNREQPRVRRGRPLQR